MERASVRFVATAATDGRFDHTIAQRFANATQQCGRMSRPLPQSRALDLHPECASLRTNEGK
eukprot:5117710-Lingulodinium_polyedra.AAC.1